MIGKEVLDENNQFTIEFVAASDWDHKKN